LPQPIDVDVLARSWTHSHEEDVDDLMVFRPSEVDFPPSRGRTSFELAVTGAMRSTGPGPDDRRVTAAGTWNLDGNLLTLQTPGQAEQRLEITSLDDERLVVRRTH
jgi:hypothetical protein